MIDYDKIPESTRMDLVETFFVKTKKSFRDPEFKAAYEKWAAERRAKHEQTAES